MRRAARTAVALTAGKAREPAMTPPLGADAIKFVDTPTRELGAAVEPLRRYPAGGCPEGRRTRA